MFECFNTIPSISFCKSGISLDLLFGHCWSKIHNNIIMYVLMFIPSLIKVMLYQRMLTVIKILIPGARFTKVKSLLSLSFTGTFPVKNYSSRENCDSRAWWISALIIECKKDFENTSYCHLLAHFVRSGWRGQYI